MNAVNEALRAHVTRVGFDLSLGKTHIATLVWIGVATSTYPARRAAELPPVEALRFEM